MAQTEIYSDINQDYYRNTKSKDLTKEINALAIKNSLRNILLTGKTQRRMMPEFGASLEQMLFEPIDTITAKRIGSIIVDEITFWEPRVDIITVDVIADEEKCRYDINIEYEIKTANLSTDSIGFVLGGL
jgi:phage baseplate assembly protein W